MTSVAATVSNPSCLAKRTTSVWNSSLVRVARTAVTDVNRESVCHTRSPSTAQRSIAIDSTTTRTPAWIVYAWPPLLWQASRAPQLHLQHLSTRVLSLGDEESPCTGQTLWGDATAQQSAGVAWDWVEVQTGVVAMADPLGVISNLKLLDEHGEALTQSEVAVQLHQLVYALPWQ